MTNVVPIRLSPAARADVGILKQIEEFARTERQLLERERRPMIPSTRAKAMRALAAINEQPTDG